VEVVVAAMQVFERGLGVDTTHHNVVLRFGVDVHARERDEVLQGRFGPEAEIISCGEIGSPEHVLALLAKHGGTVVDWSPPTTRWETANPLCEELERISVPIMRPVFVSGDFDGYMEWPRGGRV